MLDLFGTKITHSVFFVNSKNCCDRIRATKHIILGKIWRIFLEKRYKLNQDGEKIGAAIRKNITILTVLLLCGGNRL